MRGRRSRRPCSSRRVFGDPVSPSWTLPQWPAPGGVRAIVTLRGGGVSVAPYASFNLGDHVGDVAAAVAENRRRLAAAAGLPAEPVWLRQVHGIQVADLDAMPRVGASADVDAAADAVPAEARTEARIGASGDVDAAGPNAAGGWGPADAAFTRRPGRVCAILTADCLPILLASESEEGVAAAHAGWRGLAAGVIEATVRAFGVRPETLLAWLGPAIGPRHFEVGAEVREALLQGDRGGEAAFIANARGRFMADLGMLARRRLAALGVTRVYGGGECTYADPDRYFSHRRDGVTGRQAALIWLDGASTQGI
jgi:YfiH family protein